MRKPIRIDRSRMVLGVVVGIVLALVATAVGAVVPRSAVSASTAGASPALTLARPGGVQAGDVLLASVSYRLGGSASVGVPSGWNLVRADTCAGPRDTYQTQRTYSRVATGSEPASYTWSFGNAAGAVGAVVSYAGIDTSAPIAAHNGDRTRNSAWVRALGVNSPVANGMVVVALGRSSNVSIPAPNGMNARTAASTAGGPAGGLLIADVVQATPGDTGNKPAKTTEIASCNVGQVIVLRPGAGPVVPPPAPVITKPSNTVAPVLTGTSVVGSTLTVTNGVWSGTFPMTYGYQWERCATTCEAIAGATARTYAPVAADLGARLRAIVSAGNGAGTVVAMSPASTDVTEPVVVDTAPTATGVPTLSGTAQVGAALQTSNGTWSGTAPMSTTIQWSRCASNGSGCVALGGATGVSYTPVQADVGSTLRASVTATNGGGSASSTSAPSSVVVAAPSGGGGGGSGGGGGGGSSTSGTVIVNNGSWTCDGPVNLDLVKVNQPSGDAIVLAEGCTGSIGRIEVDTWTQDGVKIQNQSNPAHDLTIGGGYVTCHGISPGAHQDAVQAMGGARITFRNVQFDCLGNSNFFVNEAGSGATVPTDIVCDGCRFGAKSSTTVRVNVSVRSGIRNSFGCAGRNVREPFYFTDAAQGPVNSGNTELASSDPLCQ
jgi:Ig domain of plant-specific actin-binding protein